MIIATGVALLLVAGCTRSGREGHHAPEQRETLSSAGHPEKIRVDAYQFDAVYRHRGKPTTLQLELLCTDSVVAVSGKGYLGKSGLKARLDQNGLQAFFPTRREFLIDSLPGLLDEIACGTPMSRFDPVVLFRGLPSSSIFEPPIQVIANTRKPERPRYLFFVPDCSWQLEIEYIMEDSLWRVWSFSWQGIQNSSLEATRRQFRPSVAVPPARLEVVIPADAVPVERAR